MRRGAGVVQRPVHSHAPRRRDLPCSSHDRAHGEPAGPASCTFKGLSRATVCGLGGMLVSRGTLQVHGRDLGPRWPAFGGPCSCSSMAL